MCQNQVEIKLRDGRKHFVNCGKCPACQQSKAIANRNKIRNNSKLGYVHLFITLTYSNRFVPYVKVSDSMVNRSFMPVYRNFDVRRVRGSITRYYNKVYKTDGKPVDYLYFTQDSIDELSCGLPFLKFNGGFVDDAVGILYKPDIQNFFKRLRINYERIFKQQLDLSFFAVGEYGPKTKRPHFHALLRVKKEDVERVSATILQSWKYCDSKRLRRYIEIAKDAASYVSSYVNSSTSLSDFYRQKSIRPFSSHSKFYGFSNPAFSLSSVVEKVNQRNLYYNVPTNRNGTVIDVRTILPYYVISHWFPKVQGFSKLTSSELIEIYSDPKRLRFYARKLGYDYCSHDDIIVSDDFHSASVGTESVSFFERNILGSNFFASYDMELEYKVLKMSPLHRNVRLLYLARQRYCDIMSNIYNIPDDTKVYEQLYYDFAFNVVRAWSNYHSELIINSHIEYDENEVYKNVHVLFDDRSLRRYYPHIDIDVVPLSPNDFKSTIIKDNRLIDMYNLYDKAKKVNNIIYSSSNYQF